MSGRPLSSKEGYEKYLNSDMKLYLKYDKTQTVLFRKDLNPKNSIWYIVEYNNELRKIHYSELLKPGREQYIRVKPQNLGIIGYYETPYDIANTVYNSLDNIDDYNRSHIIKLLCKFNSQFAKKHFNIDRNLSMYQESVNNAIIAKDFGEVLGALWLNENHIEFPREYNFPLYDYIVNGIKYSAKIEKSCNTVKLSHIQELIPKNHSHWITSLIDEYVHTIKNNGVKQGNILFEDYYKQYFPSKLTGNRYWRELSNNIDGITEFYSDIVPSNIKNIVTIQNNGDFIIKIKSPRLVKFKLKEYKEQLGMELFF
ncbi:MAG: hypothetical protein PHC28_12265 [Flavobacterium sp.]|uniref:hypothetical protein n=1 Tax=Flavobacterium sp. TaxID=239 RepID=UPI00262692AA|nr:hypothetical protein [Flavobacterium sp.]MDD5151228.1 hypothetical protein [Flavobacterium sp.]